MTSLRMRVVEAGADVLETMALAYDNSRDYRLQTMNLVLDAMLDCLTENGLEWGRDARRRSDDPETFVIVPEDIADLLAVLRERDE